MAENSLIECCICLWFQKWHPDRCVKNPLPLGTAKRKFQQIQEAYSGVLKSPNSSETNSSVCVVQNYPEKRDLIVFYLVGSVLSDERKRTRYDAGIQDFDDDENDEVVVSKTLVELISLLFCLQKMALLSDNSSIVVFSRECAISCKNCGR